MLRGNYVLGYQHDTVRLNGAPYLERWFVYILGCTLRLHKFYRGDDERALHDHPWPFWTFPLTGYWERVYRFTWYSDEEFEETHYVKPWRLHYRPSKYRHMVLGTRAKADKRGVKFWTPEPFWTIVVTGRKDRSWGFYPDGKYVYYRDFK